MAAERSVTACISLDSVLYCGVSRARHRVWLASATSIARSSTRRTRRSWTCTSKCKSFERSAFCSCNFSVIGDSHQVSFLITPLFDQQCGAVVLSSLEKLFALFDFYLWNFFEARRFQKLVRYVSLWWGGVAQQRHSNVSYRLVILKKVVYYHN